MKVHFLDDDYSTNRFHEITLSPEIEGLSGSIEFFNHPLNLLEHYDKANDLPDLLFLDINMPMINGWEFLERYNKTFSTAQTKVVILTTSNDPIISEKAKAYHNIKQIAYKPLCPDSFKQIALEYANHSII